MANEQWKIHGCPVLAWAQTEVQSTGPCGIVLVQTRERNGNGIMDAEYVTAWYRLGEREWSNGHYTHSIINAQADFIKRAGLWHEG